MIRKISAHYIFPGNSLPLKRGIVSVNEEGEITDLTDTGGSLKEVSNLEFYDGIITPGFINCHTHLELSKLRGKINKHTGLINFIKAVVQLRSLDDSIASASAKRADTEMETGGIVAAADISNTSESFNIKATSKIKYFTFIEILGIRDSEAKEKLEQGLRLLEELKLLNLPGSITPHAPYSVSDTLWNMLTEHSKLQRSMWSVHNQESSEENHMFMDKSGGFVSFLSQISNDFIHWNSPGVSSLTYDKQFYSQIPKTLLVHNTFTSRQDLDSIKDLKEKIVFILCPNANLFIENQLPDVELLINAGHIVALGTDSLASNTKLSILEEMKTVQKYHPRIGLQELINFGTINGAHALGFDNQLGSIRKGKKPGLNLIDHIDFKEMKLTSQSNIKVI